MSLQPPLKLFTLQEANRLLPAVRERLKELRACFRKVQTLQGKADIEEMTGTDVEGRLTAPARERIATVNEELVHEAQEFEDRIEEFHALGCELKDLDQGLVDFYTRREGQLCYLCWREGEDAIKFWHPLEGGFQSREPL